MKQLDSRFEEIAASIPTKFTIACLDDLSAVPPDVQRLFDQSEAASFDLGLDWFRLLAASAMRPASEACIYVVSEVATGQAVVALPVRQERGGKQLFSLTNFYTSRYAPLLRSDDAEPALGALFAQMLQQNTYISIALSPMAADHPALAMTARALRQAGWRSFEYFCFGNWFLPVEGRSYAQYFDALPSRLRHTIKRKSRQFLDHAGGRFEIITGGNALEPAIAAYHRIYQDRWKKTEPYAEFMPGLIRLYASKGQLRLGMAYVNETPIAAQIWLVAHGRAVIYKLAYDTRHAHLSVGSLLTNHLMQQVLDQDRVGEIDYLIGDEPYKQDWMSQRRERWGIVAYNPRTWRGRIAAANESARRAAKGAYASLGQALSGLRGVFTQFRQHPR